MQYVWRDIAIQRLLPYACDTRTYEMFHVCWKLSGSQLSLSRRTKEKTNINC